MGQPDKMHSWICCSQAREELGGHVIISGSICCHDPETGFKILKGIKKRSTDPRPWKTTESVLLEYISVHMKEQVTGKSQHWFSKSRSCWTNLIVQPQDPEEEWLGEHNISKGPKPKRFACNNFNGIISLAFSTTKKN